MQILAGTACPFQTTTVFPHGNSTRSEVSFTLGWNKYWRLGMNTVSSSEPRIREVTVSDDAITAHLVDGRTVSVPLSWSWRLSDATSEQRQKFEILGSGQGIRWPELDEDISAEGILFGLPARRLVPR
jgi:hypothetical protein